MSTQSGTTSKGEKGKSKFQSLDINSLYRVSRGETLEQHQQKSTLPRKHGMQSLGKVPSARRPPANLPSLKSEFNNTDPAVCLVPTGGSGWATTKETTTSSSTTTTTSAPVVQADNVIIKNNHLNKNYSYITLVLPLIIYIYNFLNFIIYYLIVKYYSSYNCCIVFFTMLSCSPTHGLISRWVHQNK